MIKEITVYFPNGADKKFTVGQKGLKEIELYDDELGFKLVFDGCTYTNGDTVGYFGLPYSCYGEDVIIPTHTY